MEGLAEDLNSADDARNRGRVWIGKTIPKELHTIDIFWC
jgi:hypothetical protein